MCVQSCIGYIVLVGIVLYCIVLPCIVLSCSPLPLHRASRTCNVFTTHKTYTAYAVAPAVMVMIVLSAVAKLFGNCLCIPDLAKT